MSLEVTPFIWLDGRAKEAIQFYEQVLGAKILFTQTFGESPTPFEPPLPDDVKERLAHSVLQIGESDLFVADYLPDHPYQGGNQVTICITASDIEKSKQLFNALKQDGQVTFPLQEVHFSPAYGEVTDKFGVTFQIFTKRHRS